MAFFENLLTWTRGWRRSVLGAETVAPFEYAPTESGVTVTPATALKLSAVWACVNLRSATIASLPLHLRAEDRSPATRHPLYTILHDSPNADMTANEFWEMQLASLDMWGNAYARIERNGAGNIVALSPLRPEKVSVKRKASGAISYVVWENGKEVEHPAERVFHLKGFTLDGLVGLSPIQYQAETMGGLVAANRAAAREFLNGLKVGGFLKVGNATLNPQQRELLRSELARFGLPENAGKWMVLEAGMEPAGSHGIKVNPVDAQLLESRYFGIEEVCRAFRVPPQLIGHTDKASSWASSLENTNLGFLTYSLRPTLVRIEQAITKQLLLPAERGQYRPKFSVEGLLRADSAARASFYAQMLQNGVFSRNDVRALEDLPPVEGGDALTVQLNLTTLDRIGEEPPAEGAKRALLNWLHEEKAS
ncbi:phage portal protein [Cupriavidus gilardii]|uniref:Phage portal protein n=1 Tax=Cupriavidus gilardii TaxID=82541 RepID=A0ABY4VY80_9BURK|nr:phage portal protein [Cupriavidus gilardii]USE81147.1 phage portal protein [Cupriavidus gilardii]